VPENASSAEARRAYFRQVRESDFLPPRSWYHALRVLEGKPIPTELDQEWRLEEECRLRAEVEAFAEEFFRLPVSQRRQRWEALLSRCQGVLALTARLQALKAGLEVEGQGLLPDQVFHGRLVEQLLHAFPLPPLAHAASRQAFLRQIEGSSAAADQRSWEKAARYLRAEWPALAALDRELVKDVSRLRSRLKQRMKMRQRSLRQRLARCERLAATADSSGNKSPWWVLFVLIGAVSALVRGLQQPNNSSSSRVPSPNYTVPRDLKGFPNLEDLRRMPPAPKDGVNPHQPFFETPPIDELLDPSQYDVALVDSKIPRLLRFTPRPDATTILGLNGPQGNKVQPLLFGETALKLMGVSREQMDALCSRAAGKHPDGTPKTPPAEAGPRPPKSSPGDKTRP
jgi:hypothetical protein